MDCFRRVGGRGCFALTPNASSLLALCADPVCEGRTGGWRREWGKGHALGSGNR
jgi:hypothetical protein